MQKEVQCQQSKKVGSRGRFIIQHIHILTMLNQVKGKIVGVNYAMMESEVPIKAMKLDDKLGKIQRNKLESLRNSRDNDAVNLSLDEIRNAAKNNINLFPIVIQAIKNDCTLGEIMGAMKDEFSTWMAPSGFR